jgi:hypothetical protein
LLKNFMIAFPALLLRLFSITSVIKSAYASFGGGLKRSRIHVIDFG